MYKKVNKIAVFLLSLLFFSALSFAADAQQSPTVEIEEQNASVMSDLDLNKMPHEWLSVISGTALMEPVRTTYGWAALTDGRMITAFSENGVVLWQKPVPSAPENFLSVSGEDFLAVTLKNKNLTLINPSGVVLWTSEMDFANALPPLFGRDGRVFVFGKENIACFGMNGIKKWSIGIAALDTNLPPVELDDGSLVVFTAAQENGKTVALRVSPFGEQLERIVFAGRVLNAASTADGAMLAFADGTLGLCAVDKKTKATVSGWLIKDLHISNGIKFLNLDSDVLIAAASPSSTGTTIHILNTRAAMVIRSFLMPEIKSINYITYTPEGIFIADKNSASIYTTTARRVRGIKFPENTKKDTYDYVLYGNNGVVVFVSQSWKIKGWKILQTTPSQTQQRKLLTYNTFYEETSSDYTRMYSAPKTSRKTALQQGGYASAEREFWKDANFVMNEYFSQKTSKSSHAANLYGTEEVPYFTISDQTAVISMLSLFGTRDASNYLARILTVDKDETIIRIALKAVQEWGYDPEYRIIDALEAIIRSAGPKQELLIEESCKSLYAVCRFMGRPALYKKGKQILSNLFLPQYSRATKENARKVYEKLAELDL